MLPSPTKTPTWNPFAQNQETSRSKNNVARSIDQFWERYDALRIDDADLPRASQSSLRHGISELMRLNEDLGVYMSGGALSFTPPAQPDKELDLNSSSTYEARRRKALDLRDVITKELALYQEFTRQANDLTLENILNAADVSDDEYGPASETVDDSEQPTDDESQYLGSASGSTTSKKSQLINESHQHQKGGSERSYANSEQSRLSLPATRSIGAVHQRPAHTLSALIINNPTPWNRSSGPITPVALRGMTRLNSTSSVPSFLMNTSRQNSISGFESQLGSGNLPEQTEAWDPFRWNRLMKISDHLYSKDTRDNAGLPTAMDVKGAIAVGTSRGYILVYDYAQNLRAILGSSALAIEHGVITSVAFSSDHCIVACGYALGTVIIWDVQRNTAIRTILPASNLTSRQRHRNGHLKGAAIVSVAFLGNKRNELVTADDKGMAFMHKISKVVMVHTLDSVRLLGRYPSSDDPSAAKFDPTSSTPHKPTTVLAMAVLSSQRGLHPAVAAGLVALLTPYNLLVISTKSKVETQFRRSKPTSVSNSNLPILPATSGCLAWSEIDGLDSTRENEPHGPSQESPSLAVSWSGELVVYKITVHGKKSEAEIGYTQPKVDFLEIGSWKDENAKIVALKWLTKEVLLILTGEEELIVFDTRLMQPKERCNMRSYGLVYHDRYGKQLREACAFLKVPEVTFEMAYVHSIRVHREKVFCLGLDRMLIGTPLSWTHRLNALVKSGDHTNALQLAASLYVDGTASSVLCLPQNETDRHTAVANRIVDLVTGALDAAFTSDARLEIPSKQNNYTPSSALAFVLSKPSENRSTENSAVTDFAEQDYSERELASALHEACIVSHQEESLLFAEVYDRFENAGKMNTFMETLVPYVLFGKLRDLPATVSQELLRFVKGNPEHYSPKIIEDIILQIDPRVLDIHSTLAICNEYCLMRASAFIWNKTLNDFVSPIMELLELVRKNIQHISQRKLPVSIEASEASLSDPSWRFDEAQQIFDYLEKILTGKSYPDGRQMDGLVSRDARTEVYKFLLSRDTRQKSALTGSEGSKRTDEQVKILNSEEETPFPYLRLLLEFDAKQLFHVFEAAMDDSYLDGEDLFDKNDFIGSTEGTTTLISRQGISEILLELLGSRHHSAPSEERSTEGLSSRSNRLGQHTVTQLYIFTIRNAAKFKKSIKLPAHVFLDAAIALASDPDKSTQQERQDSVAIALRGRLLTTSSKAEDMRLLMLYEGAGFNRILETIYRKEGRYGKVIGTYLSDPQRQPAVFQAAKDLLGPRTALTELQKADVRQDLLAKVYQLVDVDGRKTADLVDKYLGCSHDKVVAQLRTNPTSQYAYLQGLLLPNNEELDQTETLDVTHSAKSSAKGIWFYPPSLDGETAGATTSDTVRNIRTDVLEPEIHERFIELMSLTSPSDVLVYLQSHNERPHRLDRVLEICRNNGVIDAVVWILERSGDVEGALGVTLEVTSGKISSIIEFIQRKCEQLRVVTGNGLTAQSTFMRMWSAEEEEDVKELVARIRAVLRVGMQICERSTRKHVKSSTISTTPESSDSSSERLWFKILGLFVDASKEVAGALSDLSVASKRSAPSPKTNPFSPTASPAHLNFPMNEYSNRMSIYQHQPHQLSYQQGSDDIFSYLQGSFHDYLQILLTTLLLTTTNSSVRPAALVRRLVEGRQKSSFTQLRPIFNGLIETYKYEDTLLGITNALFSRDLFDSVRDAVRIRARGWRPRHGQCFLCRSSLWLDGGAVRSSYHHETTRLGRKGPRDLTVSAAKLKTGDGDEENRSIVAFRCSHAYHHSCLPDPHFDECPICRISMRANRVNAVAYHGDVRRLIGKASAKGKERAM